MIFFNINNCYLVYMLVFIYIYKYIRIWVIYIFEFDSNIVSNIFFCLLICKNDIGVKNCYNKKYVL